MDGLAFYRCLNGPGNLFLVTGFCFLCLHEFGNIAKATAPFVMMIVSALIFFLVRKLKNKLSLRYHHFCFDTVTVCTLVTFYACGNYFVVKELSNEMFNLQLQLNDPIPFGWLFWILTCWRSHSLYNDRTTEKRQDISSHRIAAGCYYCFNDPVLPRNFSDRKSFVISGDYTSGN
jgi:hypothetical protein